MNIPASELPKQPTGEIYHLNLNPEDIADNIILVGDPGRVATISAKFDKIILKKSNRELCTHTGILRGKPITVISTGMGTDNIDIVLTELDALANIDLVNMQVKKEHRTLNLIRIGTSGALNAETKPGSFIASAYGFGFDGLLNFYKHDHVSDENLVASFVAQTGWNEKLSYPYCVPASPILLQRIAYDMQQGITASAPGFFGPQGRAVRAPLMYPELMSRIENFDYNNLRFTNMEMECSALFGLSKILGHNALTCCLIIANRVTGEADTNYHENMEQLIDTVLERIC